MSTEKFDVIVVGAGPGGYVAAIRAAQLGLRTAIIEAEQLGGICLNWGCIPTKALLQGAAFALQLKQANTLGFTFQQTQFDLQALVQHSRQVSQKLVSGIEYLLHKNQVQVFYGRAKFLAKGVLQIQHQAQTQQLSAPHIIVATGAHAARLTDIPVDGQQIWDYKHALAATEVPNSLVVVGSGAIGVEFASLYSALGSQVTLIEAAAQILPQEDAEVAQYMQQQLQARQIQILTQAQLNKVQCTAKGVHCEVQTLHGLKQITADKVLLAVGVRPNTQDLGLDGLGLQLEKGFMATDAWGKTNVAGVYAIGDVAGAPCLAHKAAHQALICVEKIAGLKPKPLNLQQIPSCIYSFPQVASIGNHEQQLKAQGRAYRVGKMPLQANGKALTALKEHGFIKTLVDATTGEILGAHLVGADVTEQIATFAVAQGLEATNEVLAEVIFPHPTYSEALHESILASLNRAIHI
jgi:dihydrolipoamide dehydrogenase